MKTITFDTAVTLDYQYIAGKLGDIGVLCFANVYDMIDHLNETENMLITDDTAAAVDWLINRDFVVIQNGRYIKDDIIDLCNTHGMIVVDPDDLNNVLDTFDIDDILQTLSKRRGQRFDSELAEMGYQKQLDVSEIADAQLLAEVARRFAATPVSTEQSRNSCVWVIESSGPNGFSRTLFATKQEAEARLAADKINNPANIGIIYSEDIEPAHSDFGATNDNH